METEGYIYNYEIKKESSKQSKKVGSLGAQVSKVKGPVGCNHVCFLQSGGDDWESSVFIVKRAGNKDMEREDRRRQIKDYGSCGEI